MYVNIRIVFLLILIPKRPYINGPMDSVMGDLTVSAFSFLAWGKYCWYSLGGRLALICMVWYHTGSTVARLRRLLMLSVLVSCVSATSTTTTHQHKVRYTAAEFEKKKSKKRYLDYEVEYSLPGHVCPRKSSLSVQAACAIYVSKQT